MFDAFWKIYFLSSYKLPRFCGFFFQYDYDAGDGRDFEFTLW